MEAVLTGPLGRTLLGSGELTIGCDADNQLIVTDGEISAHHALLRREGSGYAILDLGSEFGTIVNGRWLEPHKARPLQPGDVIQIGATSFTYEEFPNPAAIPTGILGVGIGNAPVPPSPSSFTDIADYDTGSFNRNQLAPAPAPAAAARSPRSLLAKPRPPEPPYTPQPWVPGGVTVYPPQQQLWQQDRRRLSISLGVMLVAIIVISLFSLLVYRSTPDKTLDTFCNALLNGDARLAYNQLSTKLQNGQGSLLAAELSFSRATICTHTPATTSGSSAKSILTTKFSQNQRVPDSTNKTLVTLIQDANGAWKIDALQSQ